MLSAREIVERLQKRNLDPELIKVLCRLADNDMVHRAQIQQLSQIVDTLGSVLTDLAGATQAIGGAVNSMQGISKENEGLTDDIHYDTETPS